MNAFHGFGTFHVHTAIWQGVFQGNRSNIRQILSISEIDADDDIFSKKLTCKRSWTNEKKAVMGYSGNEKQYAENWFSKIPYQVDLDYKDLFNQFCKSVPDATDEWSARYLPLAKQVRDYVKRLLPLCQIGNSRYELAVAAGLYAIVCFFMQNARNPEGGWVLCVPPGKYNPVSMEEQDVVFPSLPMKGPAEFPLWEYLRTCHLEPARYDIFRDFLSVKDRMSSVLIPAVSRRRQITVSETLPFVGPPFSRADAGAFLIQPFPLLDNGHWRVATALQPVAERSSNGSGRDIRLEGEYFDDQPACSGIYLSINKEKNCCTCADFEVVRNGIVVYLSQDWEVSFLQLNELGLPRSEEAERVLQMQGFEDIQLSAKPKSQRYTWSCAYDPAYLRYHIIDPATMRSIRKSRYQDPATGQYRLEVTLECPCRILILKQREREDDPQKGTRLVLEGYSYGLYGFPKDTDRARRMMYDGATANDPYLSFEFGALLKTENNELFAEEYLRFAAEKIPAAKFELAELLLGQGETEAAQALFGELYRDGYRSYGNIPIPNP